ncbi:MAG: hypothetical protein KGJ86_12065, partial [Chloroflexota bacterium]|nr:hypothetical protein [Chloroflexota bacterium]
MPGTIRAFIAVDVSDDIRREVLLVRDQFRQSRAQLKWVDPEACHLTLKFLGQVNQQQLDAISEACRAVAARHLP